MQHEQQRRGIELAILDRQRLELAAPHLDVGAVAQPPARGLRASRRERSTAITLPTNGASAAADLAGAAAEIADRPAASSSPGSACRCEARAEQLFAQLVPLPRRRLEELLRLRLPARRARSSSRRASWSAPAVFADLLAQQRPQPARRGPARIGASV